MKKKLIIGGILLFIVFFVIFLFIDFNSIKTKEELANEIFGSEECEAIIHMATNDLNKHMCKLCGKEFEGSLLREDICTECANELDRCEFCGKKISERIKEQRKTILNGK